MARFSTHKIKSGQRKLGSGDDILRQLLSFGGMTFYKKYDQTTTVDADQSIGSPTGTFTCTRSATTPATWVDINGVIQVDTTSKPRFTQGFYDSTGFVSRPGLIVEGAGTNLLVRTDGTASGSGLWTGWSWLNSVANTPTPSQVAVSSLTGISGSYSQRVQYVDGADASKNLIIVGTTTATGSIAQNNVVTISAWIRSQTGVTGASVVIQESVRSSVDGFLSASNSSALSLTSAWKRFSFTFTVPDATASKLQVRIGCLGDVDQGDLIDFEIWGVQAEISPFATTFIPTTTAALTRNAETLTYPISGNRTAATESAFIKFTPFWAGASPTTALHLMDTDADKVSLALIAASDSFSYYPNATDDAATTVTDTVDPAAFTSYVIGSISYGATAGTNTEIYNNGVSKATSTTNYTAPDMAGTNMYIGSKNDNTLQLGGIISAIAIFSDAKGAGDVQKITDIMNL